MSTLGQKIHELRLERKLTQQELSSKLGITPKMISFYEHGERMPSRETLVGLSEFFDVSVDYLLDKSSDARTKQAVATEKFGFYYTNSEREELKSAFLSANPQEMRLFEYVKICEEDLRQLFSRSLQAADFNLEHADFDEYCAMFLNTTQAKDRYTTAYEPLSAKYPPKQGISAGSTYYFPTVQPEEESANTDIVAITRMLKDLPPQNIEIVKQLLSTMFKN